MATLADSDAQSVNPIPESELHRAIREFHDIELSSRRVCRAAGLHGLVAQRVHQALGCTAWPRRRSQRRNAVSRLQALNAAWIIERIADATGEVYAARNVNAAVGKLSERGVLAVLCRIGDAGRFEALRVAVHRSADCLGRGVDAFDQRGHCRHCTASLRTDGDAWPLGAAQSHLWQLYYGLPTGPERRRMYASRATSALPSEPTRHTDRYRAEQREQMQQARREGASLQDVMDLFDVSEPKARRVTTGLKPKGSGRPPGRPKKTPSSDPSNPRQVIPANPSSDPSNSDRTYMDPTGDHERKERTAGAAGNEEVSGLDPSDYGSRWRRVNLGALTEAHIFAARSRVRRSADGDDVTRRGDVEIVAAQAAAGDDSARELLREYHDERSAALSYGDSLESSRYRHLFRE